MYIISGANDPSVPPHNQAAIETTFKHFNTGYVHLETTDSAHDFTIFDSLKMLTNLYQELGYGELINPGRPKDWNWKDVGMFAPFD